MLLLYHLISKPARFPFCRVGGRQLTEILFSVTDDDSIETSPGAVKYKLFTTTVDKLQVTVFASLEFRYTIDSALKAHT